MVKDGLTWMAHAGYAARGAVYTLVGALVLWSCVHDGRGSTPGSKGALATLANEPLGWVALYAIAIGLLAYALWRMVQGVADPDRHGTDAKALTIRAAFVVSALIHLSLAWSTASMANGGRVGSDGDQGWTAQLMAEPWGQWAVAAVGVIVVIVGVVNIVRGWKAKFLKWLQTSERKLGHLCSICRFGLIARGVVFMIVGGLLVRAARRHDPSEARGLGGAFEEILQQPFGLFLLGIAGLGMLAFAVYSFVEARYRIIRMPD